MTKHLSMIVTLLREIILISIIPDESYIELTIYLLPFSSTNISDSPRLKSIHTGLCIKIID